MKRFLRGLAIFFALIGVGIISAFAVVALLLRQEEVRVPDLAGQDIVTVIEELNQLGLQLKIDRRESSATLPHDTVVSQAPAAGSGLKKGRQVRVVVSLGPSDMQAPKVIGEVYRKADVIIRQSGFFPGTLSRISSVTVDRDVVIAQDPEPGSPMDKGGRINILISSGRKTGMLIMPKLTGKRAQEAVRIADRMGLQYRITYKTPAEGQQSPERIVLRQKPNPGWPVAPDGSVDIVVSK